MTLATGRNPESVIDAFGMTFIVQVLDRFEGDAATTVQGQVVATVELGTLITLITPTDQGQVTPRS